MNRGERIPDGVNQWTGEPLDRCPWCGWRNCWCGIAYSRRIVMPRYEDPGFPDTWAGDLMLVTFAHKGCGEDHCARRWVARSSWAEPFKFWNCPWFGPSRTEMLRRLKGDG
jgi:hypothetical protein